MAKRTRPTKAPKLSIACSAVQGYVLRMYVCGMIPRSQQAICNVMAICEEQLAGRYDLQVIDISKHPDVAKAKQIFATPVLIKELPLPERKMVGSMADRQKMLVGLDLPSQAA